VKRIEDSASAHHVAGDKNPQQCMTINMVGSIAQYILNLEEATLLWKKMLRQTRISHGKTSAGFKPSNDHITLLFSCIALG
jgi:hypothetical protein